MGCPFSIINVFNRQLFSFYVNGYTQEAYADEAGYCPQHIQELNKQLILYLQKVIS